MIFIDLSKAFDTIDYEILLKNKQTIIALMISKAESYLTNRKQIVLFENTKSDLSIVGTSVPQGSILGPLLFLI